MGYTFLEKQNNGNRFDLEWYVLRYDINKREIVYFNIFDYWRLVEEIDSQLSENFDYDDFVDFLKKELRYFFSSRSENEIAVGDTEVPRTLQRIDIYDQLIPNIDILADYIMDTWRNWYWANNEEKRDSQTSKKSQPFRLKKIKFFSKNT